MEPSQTQPNQTQPNSWVTGRGASRLLMGGVGSDEQVRVLLRTGAAGPGRPTTGGTLYDERLVRDLASRPAVDPAELATRCPFGLYVARVPRSLTVDLAAPWTDTAAALSRMPTMPALTAALLQVRMRLSERRLPWVATVSGFVVLGADLVGIAAPEEAAAGQWFRLEPPGEWFAAVDGRWFPTGRGGRPWHLWDPVRSATG
jgi:hypothetical protein